MFMIICSFNIKNNFFYHKDKTPEICNFIHKYHIDILCVQEYLFKDSFKFNLDKYKIYGIGRFRKKKHRFNESNNIITNLDVSYANTKRLPWFFTTLPRIYTYARLKYKSSNITVINTHVDYLHTLSRKKQLNKLLSFIKNESKENKIILMGDFNADIYDKSFIKFINELNNLGINRVDINDKTFKLLNKPIDHIFISKEFKINSYKVLIDENYDISDHYPLIVDIDI